FFGGAVIDEKADPMRKQLLDRIAEDPAVTVLTGGHCDDSVGYFVAPTVLVCDDPGHEVFTDEYFGPIIAVHPYDDGQYGRTLEHLDNAAPYGVTGAVFADDRDAVLQAERTLRYAAGNFYVNDKPTGSSVGQHPFGGARRSGTNDKAGSMFNLQRWVNPRAIKENFDAPSSIEYPHMG